MALESWSSNTNKVIYDERIYKTVAIHEDEPSAQQAYKESSANI